MPIYRTTDKQFSKAHRGHPTEINSFKTHNVIAYKASGSYSFNINPI